MGVTDRDWYRDALRQREGGNARRMPLTKTFRVTLGVLVFGVVAALVLTGLQVMSGRTSTTSNVPPQSSALEDMARRNELEAKEAPRLRQEQKYRTDEAARLKALAPLQTQAAAAEKAALASAERKARAWAKFYRKPAECEGPFNSVDTMECSNHFIRSKRAFEAAYAAGKL